VFNCAKMYDDSMQVVSVTGFKPFLTQWEAYMISLKSQGFSGICCVQQGIRSVVQRSSIFYLVAEDN